MRRSLINLRSSKGRGWYKQYIEKGPESFLKNSLPTSFDWNQKDENNQIIIRPKVYLDINIQDERLGRLEVELAHDIVPITVQNFINLILGKEKFCYKGSKVHEIISETSIRLGDVETSQGKLSHSSFKSRYFRDENFIIPHSSRGILSMVAPGVHSNGSQFYITLKPTPHLNGRAVAFGHITQGESVLKEIEKVLFIYLF